MQYLVLTRFRSKKNAITGDESAIWSDWAMWDGRVRDSVEDAMNDATISTRGSPLQETESRIIKLDAILQLPQQRARVVMEDVVPGE